MKKVLLVFYFLIFVFEFGICQNPLLKQWDFRFGGTDHEYLSSFHKTDDGGYILGGFSYSNLNGDKTQTSSGSADYWIVKIDSLGNKEWDKDFGGSLQDYFMSLQQTFDGGFILGGHSFSDSSGDKTQDGWGNGDYWVVKLDSLGNKQWDKNFGGMDYEYFFSLQQTTDKGYVLGGYSNSGISGDKTQATWGNSFDYWIVKIDSLGNKEWDKDFGGTNDDKLYSLQQTDDGGYILGGTSNSGIGGDKTQALWGVSGDNDYWILKIDSLGNKEWDKDFGGTNSDFLSSLCQTSDKGYILGGYSFSGISGNKTQPNWDTLCTPYCTSDYWIVKIDSMGSKLWDKDFGGIDKEEDIGNISQTPDNGFLIAGTSYSNISGNKSENNLGSEQTWVVKMDSIGGLQWDKTLRTDCNLFYQDEIGFAVQAKDGCYTMANYTSGWVAGDKTQPNWDTICNPYCTRDYWIIKFCDSTATTNLTPGPSPKERGMEVFPNPVREELVIRYPLTGNKEMEITITDILGRSSPLNPPVGDFPSLRSGLNEIKISMKGFAVGVYVIKLRMDGITQTKKIIKIE